MNFHTGIPSNDNPWGLKLDIHPPTSDEPYWFSVVVDLDKRGEEDSSMQVSQIKLKGNVAFVRIEVRTIFTSLSLQLLMLSFWLADIGLIYIFHFSIQPLMTLETGFGWKNMMCLKVV